jgi:hypothetical protein
MTAVWPLTTGDLALLDEVEMRSVPWGFPLLIRDWLLNGLGRLDGEAGDGAVVAERFATIAVVREIAGQRLQNARFKPAKQRIIKD